jgi:hypothetical protein
MSEANAKLADIKHRLTEMEQRASDIGDKLDEIERVVRLQMVDQAAAELVSWDRSLTHRERRARHLPADELEQLGAERDVWHELVAGLARKRAEEQ